MTPDEIVRALRNCKAYKTKSDLQTTMLMAADMIESLQAELTASQRREQAAVEDMTQMAQQHLLGDCTFCKHRSTPDMRHKPCKGCIQKNSSHKHFEWRGHQEAPNE